MEYDYLWEILSLAFCCRQKLIKSWAWKPARIELKLYPYWLTCVVLEDALYDIGSEK